MSIALIVAIVGGFFFVLGHYVAEPFLKALGELGKWAFIVGLAAWFFGK